MLIYNNGTHCTTDLLTEQLTQSLCVGEEQLVRPRDSLREGRWSVNEWESDRCGTGE